MNISHSAHGGCSEPLYSRNLDPSSFSTMKLPCSIKPWHFGFLGLPLTMTTSPGHSFTTARMISFTNSLPLSEWRILGVPNIAKTLLCKFSATSAALFLASEKRMCIFDQWSMKCPIQ